MLVKGLHDNSARKLVYMTAAERRGAWDFYMKHLKE